eukprot:superscaffoldBa00003654_g17411
MVAMFCSTTQAEMILQARSGATLSPRKQLKRALSMPKVISIMTLVLVAIPSSNLWHSADSLKIRVSWTDPGHFASTLVTIH